METTPQYNHQHTQLKSIFVTQDKNFLSCKDKELILMAVTEGQLISDGTVVWKVKKIGSEVPAGIMQMFAGNTIPAGWLLCDGSAISRTDYAKLFSAIGTTWGTGDGSTTFNLPNSIGRFAEGAATSGSYKSAGLPNITGGFGANEAYWFARCGNNGALTAQNSFESNDRKYANALSPNSFNENHLGANYVFIDASKSSSVYGNSTTVQPPSFAVKYIIKY